jgi:hypothetical protein
VALAIRTDAGQSKPALHGAVSRSKSARSNRWGALPDASGKEDSHSSSVVSVDRRDNERATGQQRATPSSHGGVSNNLRGNQDPVLVATGKVKLLQSNKRNVFKSADALKLPQGHESRVFHRANFLDHNAAIRSASVYAGFIVEDACERGIPEEKRICASRNVEVIPAQEV